MIPGWKFLMGHYTTDQGAFYGEHSATEKVNFMEESARVPMIVRYPGVTPPGSVCDKLVINNDWAPTFLDFAGVPVPKEMQGVSMRPLLEGKSPAEWRRAMLY